MPNLKSYIFFSRIDYENFILNMKLKKSSEFHPTIRWKIHQALELNISVVWIILREVNSEKFIAWVESNFKL